MDFKILSAVDFHRNELKNPVAQNLGTAPGTPVAGLFYMDTTVSDARMRYYNGSTWIDLYQPITDVDGSASINVGISAGVATVSFAPTGNVDFNGHRITGLADPVGAQDAATKGYADSIALGLDVKQSVRAATTVNITISGTQTIDGVELVAGDRVLVKNQTTGSQNGIYVVAAGAWARASDGTNGNLNSGAFVFVEEGSTLDDSGWVLSTANPITVGTTAQVWSQFSGAGTGVDAGDGLIKTGNILDVVGTADRITVGVGVDIASTYVGQASITTLGTITTGVWNGTTIAVNRGGTGITSYTTGNYINASGATTLQQRTPAQVLSDIGAAASSHTHSGADITSGTVPVDHGGTGQTTYTNGQLLIGNTTGGTLAKATLTGTTNRIIVTNGAGSITLNADATDANTVNKIVARDASGNFSAGTITAALTGNASTATALATARAINGANFDGTAAITVPGNFANRTTSESGHIPFISTTATGNQQMYTNTGVRINPATATITASAFVGSLTGNATTATTADNLKSNATTGVIQITGPAAATTRVMTFPNADATVLTSAATVTAAQGGTGISSYTTNNYIRASGTSSLEQRTPAQVLADIGAAASSHVHSAADITSGTLAVARGGTGLASYTIGNYIYASGATTLAQRTPTQMRTDLSIDNVENTALSTWAGASSITTVGTIGTGTWAATDVAVVHGGTGSSTAAGARANLGAAGVYRTAIGNGSSTSLVVTHNLNNRFVTVNVWETASPYAHVHCGIEATTVNTTTLYFSEAPASGEYTVVVTG